MGSVWGRTLCAHSVSGTAVVIAWPCEHSGVAHAATVANWPASNKASANERSSAHLVCVKYIPIFHILYEHGI